MTRKEWVWTLLICTPIIWGLIFLLAWLGLI